MNFHIVETEVAHDFDSQLQKNNKSKICSKNLFGIKINLHNVIYKEKKLLVALKMMVILKWPCFVW